MNIILIGPPGSGKGTQTANIAKKYELCIIAVGDMLREEARNNTEQGKKIKHILASGELVPIDITLKLIKKKIQQTNSSKGIIFDGFPRILEQAEALEELANIDFVFELTLTDDAAIKRLSQRRQCEKGHIYGQEKKPKKQNTCDIDRLPLTQREDDTPKAIEERLIIYHDETEPLLEYYRPRNIVHTIDATKKPNNVFTEIQHVIDTAD